MVLTLVAPPGPGESSPVAPVPGVPGGRDEDAVWSLLLVDLWDGSVEEIVRSGTRDYGGRFSPDGSRIVWVSERSGAGDLYSMDVASREVTRLTSHELPDRDFSLAEHHLVLRRGWWEGPRGGEEILLLHLATGEEEALTENHWNDTGLDLSARGEMVCWTSKEMGHWESEILVMDLNSRTVTNVSRSPGRDDFCQWHPTESVVFFMSWREGDPSIFRSEWGFQGPPVNLSRYHGEDTWPSVAPPR
jgi:Tol biopolymer transport system component